MNPNGWGLIDHTMVQHEGLSIVLQLQICAKCHNHFISVTKHICHTHVLLINLNKLILPIYLFKKKFERTGVYIILIMTLRAQIQFIQYQTQTQYIQCRITKWYHHLSYLYRDKSSPRPLKFGLAPCLPEKLETILFQQPSLLLKF